MAGSMLVSVTGQQRSPGPVRWTEARLRGVAVVVVIGWLLAVVVTGYGRYRFSQVMHRAEDSGAEYAAYLVLTAVSLSIGVFLVYRSPRNLCGWLLVASVLLFTLDGVASEYGSLDVRAHVPAFGAGTVVELDAWAAMPEFGLIALLALLFPTGGPPSRRWRPFGWASALIYAATWGLRTVSPGRSPSGYFDGLPGRRNPWAAFGPDSGWAALGHGLVLATMGCLLLSVASLGWRFRRADRLTRLQIAWPALVLGVSLALIAGAILSDAAGLKGLRDALSNVSEVGVLFALPVAVALALARYRLYDVERLAAATLVYAVLTFAVVATYGGVSVALAGLATDGRRDPVVVSIATLAAAALVRPARRWLQTAVDRRFRRRSHAALRRIERLTAEMAQRAVRPQEVRAVLADALEDPGLRLSLWVPSRAAFLDTGPGAVTEPVADPGRRSQLIERDGAALARIDYNPVVVEPSRLAAIVQASRLALENARLQLEIDVQLEEVRASRQRIVAAAYEERRRLERDLHDGAQQRLVALALSLRVAQARLARYPEAVAALDEGAAELTAAVAELRELARGLHPATLTEEGLAAAIESLARRTPLPVGVTAQDCRFPAALEAAAYFVTAESLANVVKHANAGRADVCICCVEGWLQIEVRDDGNGRVDMAAGSGLRGLADRVDALGGRMDTIGLPGRGTTVRAALPVAAASAAEEARPVSPPMAPA